MATQQTDEIILQTDPQLKRHLHSLALTTLIQYRRWCAENGFCRRLDKSQANRRRELQHAARKQAIAAMAEKRREARRVDNTLANICQGQHWSSLWSPRIRAFYFAVSQNNGHRSERKICRVTLEALLTHLQKCKVKFLDGDPYFPRFGDRPGNTALEALPLFAAHHKRWVRPLHTWKPSGRSPRSQFRSLLHHLFVQFDEMPRFFEQVWLSGHGDRQGISRGWYLHHAAGYNLANCLTLPIPYTKKMAHYFLQAPHNASIDQALRWGEVKGLGGQDQLARTVIRTRLAIDFQNARFWNIVLQWMIRHFESIRSHVNSIVDYIHFQRFVPRYEIDGQGQPDVGQPREPNFSMRGRTPESLLRQVARWHETQHETFVFGSFDWMPCGVPSFDLLKESDNGDLEAWSIRELLNSKSVAQEGQAMDHCVGTYIDLCLEGRSSIWTMELETLQRRTKLLTIEIDTEDRSIAQFSGKSNRAATAAELKIIQLWAKGAGLKIDEDA